MEGGEVLGANIRLLRWHRKMTKAVFTAAMGLDHRVIANIELGSIQPSSEQLPKIASILGVTIEELVSDSMPVLNYSHEGERIAAKRVWLGYSGRSIASMLGITQQTYARAETHMEFPRKAAPKIIWDLLDKLPICTKELIDEVSVNVSRNELYSLLRQGLEGNDEDSINATRRHPLAQLETVFVPIEDLASKGFKEYANTPKFPVVVESGKKKYRAFTFDGILTSYRSTYVSISKSILDFGQVIVGMGLSKNQLIEFFHDRNIQERVSPVPFVFRLDGKTYVKYLKMTAKQESAEVFEKDADGTFIREGILPDYVGEYWQIVSKTILIH